ncbi:MAG TPA: hypothetical protein VLA34_14740, partial [Candidatus Krumholzibacterium sp.]|nr:hypothetical protein [Candidatus Krumholzibacterium sp.]
MKSAAMTALVIMMVLPLQAWPAPGDWNVYLDASAIVDIHVAGDSLFCATNGGILIFDLTDSTFTQILDGLGLRSADIRSVTVDAQGSIWAAFNSAGISRIDDPGGANAVQTYTANSTFNEILSDTVTCIERIGEEVYYGCTAGVGKFFEGIHSLEPNLSDSLSGKRVNCIFHDEDADVMWIAYDGGVARFARETFNYSSWPVGQAYSVCLHEGAVYCGTDDGVYRFEGADWALYGSGFHNELAVLSLASGSSGFYAITEQRLYRYNGTYWASIDAAALISIFDQEYRIRTNHIAALAVDGAGTPWVGGRVQTGPARGSFLTGYYGGAWNNKAMPLLSQNQIVSLSASPGGGVWASTYYGISYRSGGGDWTAYTRMRPDTGDDEALSYYAKNLALLFDSQGFLWCNSLKYDLDLLDVGDPFSRVDDLWHHFSVADGLSITSDRFVRAKEDPAGNRWFMSDDDEQTDGKWGINIINAAGTEWFIVDPLTTPSMPSGSVFDCDFTPVGVYLALRGYGVVFWRTNGFTWNTLTNQDGDVWTTVLGQDDLPATQLKAIEAAQDGSLWVGTSSGLVRQSGNDIDVFELKTGFSDDGLIGLDIYDLELDIRGNVWVA